MAPFCGLGRVTAVDPHDAAVDRHLEQGMHGQADVSVDPKQVESRPVTPGMRVDGQIVIEKGLAAGEMVVTEGQLRLAADSVVKIRDNSAP